MLRTLLMLTAAVATLAAGSVAADVYKFKDDKGNVLYTDKPSTLPAERLNIQSQKTDTVAAQARADEELKRQQSADASQKAATQSGAQQQSATPPAATANDKAAGCAKARDLYTKYSTSQRLYESLPDGGRRYLSDAEIDAARASAKASMDVMCK
ncbi:MAG TPA: DUF4124 domain-containing protein [Steroidobacteraceae bacterium]